MVLAQALHEIRLGLPVQQIVEAYGRDDMKTVREQCDVLLRNMVELGFIPDSDNAFIEYQGVYEFDLVPVCYFPEGASKERWFNVTAKGSVEAY